jgi:tetratricopeptide (TPR) repeat protein
MNLIRQNYHTKIAAYFSGKSLYLDEFNRERWNMRKVVELPWQQSESGMYEQLRDLLINLDFFLCLSKMDRYEIWRHWKRIPGEKREIASSYQKAIGKWENEIGKSRRFELALNELEHFLVVSGEKELSGQLAQRSYDLAIELYPEKDIIIAIRKNNLATAYYHQMRYKEALDLIESAMPVYLNYFDRSKEDYWIIQINLGVCNGRTGRFKEAEKILKECIIETRNHLGRLHTVTLTAINDLAEVQWYNGNFQDARELYEEAISGRKEVLGTDHPMTKEIQANIDFLDVEFINVPIKKAMNNLIKLLQIKKLPASAEKIKKL